MESVLLAVRRCVELEQSKLDRAFCEGCVVIQHMVSRLIVMMVPSIVRILSAVPDVCKLGHGVGLLLVEDLQELGVHRFAVAVHSAVVQVQGFGNQALVACHDVGQVPKCLRGVAFCSNVYVDFMESNA